MQKDLLSPAGRLIISSEPLALSFSRHAGPVLISGRPALWVRAYGVELPLELVSTVPPPAPGGEINLTLAAPVRPETATLRVAPAPGGFRLVLSAPAGASAAGISLRLEPGAPWY